MTSCNTIYTIQTNKSTDSSVTKIETVTNRGLYRFTVLGMNARQASETKDRVYSSLRSSSLLNLKSDNRKIIVDISPESVDRKDTFYDLGIALSCIYSIEKKTPPCKILALGGLSISGKILSTHKLYQAIYTAYLEDIPVIACGHDDFLTLKPHEIEELEYFGIQIISDISLHNLVDKLKKYKDVPNKTEIYNQHVIKKDTLDNLSSLDIVRMNDMDSITRGLYISLCGGHHVVIETNSVQAFNRIYSNMYTYREDIPFTRKLYRYYENNMQDTEDYLSMDVIEYIKDKHLIQKPTKVDRVLLGIYPSCTCEYQYAFFTAQTHEKRCICSKRNIIQHRRSVENTFFPLFNMRESYTHHSQDISDNTVTKLHKQIDTIRAMQRKRFIHQRNMGDKDRYFFGKNTYLNKYNNFGKPEDVCTPEAYTLWNTSTKDTNILRIAVTIEDILAFETSKGTQEKKLAVSEQALLLALSYIPRMDS